MIAEEQNSKKDLRTVWSGLPLPAAELLSDTEQRNSRPRGYMSVATDFQHYTDYTLDNMSASPSYHTRSRFSHSTKSSISTRANAEAYLALIDREVDREEELEMMRIRAKEVEIETKLKKIRAKLKKIKARKDVALTATGSNRDKDSVVSSRGHETGLRLDPTPLDAVQRTADYVISQIPQQTVAEPMPLHGGEKEVVFNSSQISGGLSCPEICIKNNTQTNMDFNDHLMFDTEFEELCSDTLGIPDPSPCDDLINSDELSLSPTPLATTISSKKYEEADEEADLLIKNQEMTEVIHSDHDYVQRSPSSFDSSSVSSPVTPQSVESVERIPNQSLNGQGDEDDDQQIHLIEESVVLVEEEFTDDYSTINLNTISTSGLSIEVGSGGESISTHNAWVLNDNIIETEPSQSHKVIRLPPDKTVESFTTKHNQVSNTISNKNNNNVSLVLTEEEKTLPIRESYVLPTNMPLTKEGERALKSVRRKIRNNVSAKKSRKRRQEYVDGLEKRVKLGTVENQQLHKKIISLETQNISLVTQMKKLQSFILSSTNEPVHTSTCIRTLLPSFALIIVPVFNPFRNKIVPDGLSLSQTPMPGNSRSLLHKIEDYRPSNKEQLSTIFRRNQFLSTPQSSLPPLTMANKNENRGSNNHQETEFYESQPKAYTNNNPNSAHTEINKVILKLNASIRVVVSIQTRRGALVWEPGGPALLRHLAISTPIGNCT